MWVEDKVADPSIEKNESISKSGKRLHIRKNVTFTFVNNHSPKASCYKEYEK